jgi:hypothetical protein
MSLASCDCSCNVRKGGQSKTILARLIPHVSASLLSILSVRHVSSPNFRLAESAALTIVLSFLCRLAPGRSRQKSMSPLVWAGCMAVVSAISLPSTTFPVSVLKIRPSVCALPISPPFSLLPSMPHPRKYSKFFSYIYSFKLIGTIADGSTRYSVPAALPWVKNMSAKASTSLLVQ